MDRDQLDALGSIIVTIIMVVVLYFWYSYSYDVCREEGHTDRYCTVQLINSN